MFIGIVESGSRAQTITCNAQGANDKTWIARVGRTTKPLHEQVHTMLVNETKNTV